MKKCIVYVGREPGFAHYLKSQLAAHGAEHDWSVREIQAFAGAFAEVSGVEEARLVALDFRGHDGAALSEEFCQSMALFKRQSRAWAIPVIGIFEDRAQLEALAHLFTLGLSYAHVIGSDLEAFCQGLRYLSGEGNPAAPVRKLAVQMDRTIHLEAFAAAVEMSCDEVWLDCDILPTEGAIQEFAPFGDKRPQHVVLEDFTPASRWHNMLYMAKLRLEYPAPWEATGEGLLSLAEMEEWVKHQVHDGGRTSVLIQTQNFEITQKIMAHPVSEHLRLAVLGDFNDFKGQVASLLPQVVCVDLLSSDETQNCVYVLRQLLESRRGWAPYIMICNTDLPAIEWRTQLGHDRVIAHAGALTTEQLEKCLEISLKIVHGHGPVALQFALNDPQRLLRFSLPVKLTQLSLGHVLFTSHEEIPLYSVLHLKHPTGLYLLVVPPTTLPALPPQQGQCYEAIIHGIDERGEWVLREFIKGQFHASRSEHKESSERASAARSRLFPLGTEAFGLKPLMLGKSKL